MNTDKIFAIVYLSFTALGGLTFIISALYNWPMKHYYIINQTLPTYLPNIWSILLLPAIILSGFLVWFGISGTISVFQKRGK